MSSSYSAIGFRALGLGFRVSGLGLRVQELRYGLGPKDVFLLSSAET